MVPLLFKNSLGETLIHQNWYQSNRSLPWQKEAKQWLTTTIIALIPNRKFNLYLHDGQKNSLWIFDDSLSIISMKYKSNDIEDVSSKFNRQPYLFKGLIGFGLVSMQNEKFQMKKGFFKMSWNCLILMKNCQIHQR